MNALKAYVRRTMIAAARDYSNTSRRTPESTKSACQDATCGTDTGWWNDLIYTAPMLDMAHRYRRGIATALEEYEDATGEEYRHDDNGREITAAHILSALLGGPYSFDDYRDTAARGIGNRADASLLGLRFAVEWFADEVARELCPDL